MINVRSITPLTTSETAGRGLGRGEAAIWYPDGDMVALVHGNLSTLPDPIDPLEIAQLFAAAPELYATLVKIADWSEVETIVNARIIARAALAKVNAQ